MLGNILLLRKNSEKDFTESCNNPALLKDNTYDTAAMHVGVNDLRSNVKSTNEFCEEFMNIGLTYYLKSVGIRSFSGPYFPTFGLNTERYSKY